VVSVVAFGCSPVADHAFSLAWPVPRQTATVLPSGFPDGIYAIDTYKLKFQGRHFTLLTEFDQEVAQGSFVVNDNRIKFTEADFAPECGPEYSPYSYQWSFDGKALNFSNPDDKCGGRPNMLMESSWVFQGQAQ